MAEVICLVDFTDAILVLIIFKLAIKELFVQRFSRVPGI